MTTRPVPAGRPAPAARSVTAGLPRDGRQPLLRLLSMARPLRGRMLAAVAADRKSVV